MAFVCRHTDYNLARLDDLGRSGEADSVSCPHPRQYTCISSDVFTCSLNLCLPWAYCVVRASLAAQRVKCLPAVRETWVRSPGWEDPLGKEMAAHSNVFAQKIPWTGEPSRLQSMGSQRIGHDWATSLSLSLYGNETHLILVLLEMEA